MSLNFNTYPYYDDFDPEKNFHRILFKPGYAVQARELTQSQTILQNQISEFASAIYSQNTPVTGGQVTTNLSCFYLKLNPTFNGSTITAANFANQVIFDSETGTILARVIATAETTASGTNAGDPPTLIVTYLSGARFTDGLTIQTTGSTQYYATIATSVPAAGDYSTGFSSTASVANGVFFIVSGYNVSETDGQQYSIGNFVNVANQTIILDKYGNTPSYRIGLELTETIYDYVNDASLLDPAIGASNYQAPGADRYVLSLQLVNLPLTLGNDQNFIELVRIQNGQIVSQVDGTVYSTLDDYFAKRDYETNGDYVVNDFKLTPVPNASGVSSLYDMKIGKGIAYVHGYRIENQSQQVITNSRARTTNVIPEDAIYVDYGNYLVTDSVGGIFDIGQVPQVTFHTVGAANIVSPTNGLSANSNTYNSTVVGTGFIRNLQYVSGSGSNTKTYVYNAYISDFTANTLSGTASNASTATSVVINDTGANFSTVANAYFGVTLTATTGAVNDVRTVTNYQVSGATKTFTVSSPLTVTPTTATTITLNFTTEDIDSIVIADGSYNLKANANINIAGRVQNLPQGATVFNSVGTPELIFPLGYPYVANVSSTSYYSTRVYRGKQFLNNQITLSALSGITGSPLRFEGPTSAQSGTVNQQNFIVINTTTGNILDFTTSGNTIAISNDHTTANLYSTAYNNMVVDVFAQVQVSSGDSTYILKSKNLVTGNTAYGSTNLTQVGSTGTYVDLSAAQTLIPKSSISFGTKMPLYVTDIKKIDKVYDTGTTSASVSGVALSSFTDITNYFKLDNGQKDSFYDFGSVSLIPGAPLPSGNILVVYDYYSHTQASSGDGYFSIQSYQAANSTFGGVSTAPEGYAQIPTYTAKDGNVYKLADCIDFRPSRVNGQTAYIWEYSTGGQPSSTNDIGVLIPQNLTNFQSNYGYYLGRQDRLVLTKDKSFQIIQGNPSINPSLPPQPTGSLLLANLSHDPYTAYIPGEGPVGATPNMTIDKILHKRWAKSDITDLETRINNLEYYTALSQLEATTALTQVPDNNGISRPNYGILVDDFSGYSTADTSNGDFGSNINIRTNELKPLVLVDNFQLQNPVVLSSLGTLGSTNTYQINNVSGTQTNLFTLPITGYAPIAYQPLASSTISVNPFAVVTQQGVVQLNPPMDNWVDNIQAPVVTTNNPGYQFNQTTGGINATNMGDYQTIPGTQLVVTNSNSIANPGASVGNPNSPQSTRAYASQISNPNLSTSSSVSSVFATNNGYLTNVSISPYIRPQQIIVRASGLAINTPLTAWFDGINVNHSMTAPNTIELTNVSGKFNIDDVVGFNLTISGVTQFVPIGRAVSVYNYPNGTQTRLYIADFMNIPVNVGSTVLQNAMFDANGNYIQNSATATGTPTSGIVSTNLSGQLGGIGGGYTQFNGVANNTGNLVVAPPCAAYGAFLNNYGVWGDSNGSGQYAANLAFQTTNTAGTYTLTAAADNNAVVNLNGTQIFLVGTGPTDNAQTNFSTTTQYTTTLSANTTYQVSWTANNNFVGAIAAFGLVITDPNGVVVFNTRSVNGLTYNQAGQTTQMPGGGTWSTGVNQVILDGSANSTVDNFYQGSQITIKSQYVAAQVQTTQYTGPVSPSATSGSSIPEAVTLTNSITQFNFSINGGPPLSTYTYTWSGPTTGQGNGTLDYYGKNSGTVTGTGNFPAGTYTFTFSFSDGNTATVSSSIALPNPPAPVIPPAPPISNGSSGAGSGGSFPGWIPTIINEAGNAVSNIVSGIGKGISNFFKHLF